MNEQIQKRLKQVFLDLERGLREFGEIREDIEEDLSRVVGRWQTLPDLERERMVSDIMRRAMNDVGICYTDHPIVWISAEEVAFSNLVSKIRNLLSVIDSYKKNNQSSAE